jgi:hypothetical protein
MSDAIQKKKKATYDDILKLPDNVVGEIINGELHCCPVRSEVQRELRSAWVAGYTG